MAQDTKAAAKQDTNAANKQDTKTAGKKSAVKKILTWGLGAALIAVSAVGATLYLTGNSSVLGYGEPKTEYEASTSSHGSSKGEVKPENSMAPAQYVALDPPFVVNFEDQGMMRYLQVGVTVMARDKAVIEAVSSNLPPIRNNLIMLFGSQSLATLASADGREKLRNQALEEIQSVLRKEIGKPGVEAVYFTNFVMQ